MVIMRRCVAIWWATILVVVLAQEDSEPQLNTLPGCNQTCVNSSVMIPYPFGIGHSCSYNSSYEIICKHSNSSSGEFTPFLLEFDVQVFDITFNFDNYDNFNLGNIISNDIYTSTLLIIPSESKKVCSVGNDKGNSNGSSSSSTFNTNNIISSSLIGSPFAFGDHNQMVVQGCPGHVNIRNSSGSVVGGCSAFCKKDDPSTGTINSDISACNGVGGCLINNIGEQKSYEVELLSDTDLMRDDYANNSNSNSNINSSTSICMNVTLMYGEQPLKAILSWQGPQISNPGINIECKDFYGACKCTGDYYKGNPYLPDGCKATLSIHERLRREAKRRAMIIGLSSSLGLTTLIICCYGLFHAIRRWRRMRQRADFFKRNGGLLLQQQITTRDNMVDKTMVFSVADLEKATDNFNTNRILGRGGQGTVYKGMVLDGRVVAIKKSLKVDESQIEQLFNEVVILSQISHRNVVKLLGCCLETEVPLLVYEFIPNGTLSQLINNPSEDFHITWKMRLQIAAESAGALAYLHSASATPIYHRDVKSSNILLDEKYRAKIADFGTSRTFTIDQIHLTTLVQGTFGYLDPEYFQTNQFTEKSDVYSFGVVLLELLTGQKPLTSEHSGGWKSLTMEFLLHMETSRLYDIIDPRILDEAKQEDLLAVANIAKPCLNLNGKHRPTMIEVISVLEGIRSSTSPAIVGQIHSKEKNDTIELENAHLVVPSISIEVKPLLHHTI